MPNDRLSHISFCFLFLYFYLSTDNAELGSYSLRGSDLSIAPTAKGHEESSINLSKNIPLNDGNEGDAFTTLTNASNATGIDTAFSNKSPSSADTIPVVDSSSTHTSPTSGLLPLTHKVVLRKGSSGFGFKFRAPGIGLMNYMAVSDITTGGVADQSKLVHVGDQIVSINGVMVLTMTYEEAENLFKTNKEVSIELIHNKPRVPSPRIARKFDSGSYSPSKEVSEVKESMNVTLSSPNIAPVSAIADANSESKHAAVFSSPVTTATIANSNLAVSSITTKATAEAPLQESIDINSEDDTNPPLMENAAVFGVESNASPADTVVPVSYSTVSTVAASVAMVSTMDGSFVAPTPKKASSQNTLQDDSTERIPIDKSPSTTHCEVHDKSLPDFTPGTIASTFVDEQAHLLDTPSIEAHSSETLARTPSQILVETPLDELERGMHEEFVQREQYLRQAKAQEGLLTQVRRNYHEAKSQLEASRLQQLKQAHEVSRLSNDLTKVHISLAAARSENDQLSNALAQLQQQHASDSERWQDEIQHLNNVIAVFSKKEEEFNDLKVSLNEQLNRFQEESNDLQGQVQTLQSQLNEEQNHNAIFQQEQKQQQTDLESQIALLKQEKETLHEQLNAYFAEKEGAIRALEERDHQLEDLRKELEASVTARDEQMAILDEERQKHKAQMEELLKNDKKNWDTQRASIVASHEEQITALEAQQHEQFEMRLAVALQNERDAANSRETTLQQEILDIKSAATDAQDRCLALETVNSELSSEKQQLLMRISELEELELSLADQSAMLAENNVALQEAAEAREKAELKEWEQERHKWEEQVERMRTENQLQIQTMRREFDELLAEKDAEAGRSRERMIEVQDQLHQQLESTNKEMVALKREMQEKTAVAEGHILLLEETVSSLRENLEKERIQFTDLNNTDAQQIMALEQANLTSTISTLQSELDELKEKLQEQDETIRQIKDAKAAMEAELGRRTDELTELRTLHTLELASLEGQIATLEKNTAAAAPYAERSLSAAPLPPPPPATTRRIGNADAEVQRLQETVRDLQHQLEEYRKDLRQGNKSSWVMNEEEDEQEKNGQKEEVVVEGEVDHDGYTGKDESRDVSLEDGGYTANRSVLIGSSVSDTSDASTIVKIPTTVTTKKSLNAPHAESQNANDSLVETLEENDKLKQEHRSLLDDLEHEHAEAMGILERQLVEVQNERDKLRREMEGLRQSLTYLQTQEQQRSLEADKEELQSQLGQLKEDLAAAQQQLAESRASALQWDHQVKELQAQLEQMKALQIQEKGFDSRENEKNDDAEESSEEERKSEGEKGERKARASTDMQLNEDLRQRLAEMESKQVGWEQERSELTAQVQQLMTQCKAEHNKDSEKASQINSTLRADLKQALEELQATKDHTSKVTLFG